MIPIEQTSKPLMPVARAEAIAMLRFAQTAISGHKVGAAVVASNGENRKVFSGCNIELATSVNIHAERVAWIKAVSEGYTDIKVVVVTSTHEEQLAALCGACRQDFMYINPDCLIQVVGLDGMIKLEVKLKDVMLYPYMGKGRLRQF